MRRMRPTRSPRRWTRCTWARSWSPTTGSTGSYDGVWELFEGGASTEAQEQVETLTAGVGAGDAFEQILPEKGTLKTKVLFDQEEQAFSVVAIARFEAVGTGKEGDDVRMTSRGQFVFEQVDGRMAGRVLQGVARQRGRGIQRAARARPRRGARHERPPAHADRRHRVGGVGGRIRVGLAGSGRSRVRAGRARDRQGTRRVRAVALRRRADRPADRGERRAAGRRRRAFARRLDPRADDQSRTSTRPR